MKKFGHFFKTVKFWYVLKLLQTIDKNCKNHMQPNLSQVLSCTEEVMRMTTWEEGVRFHFLTNFTIHFTLCLIFISVWPKEDLFFKITKITQNIYYIYTLYMCVCIYICVYICFVYIYLYYIYICIYNIYIYVCGHIHKYKYVSIYI